MWLNASRARGFENFCSKTYNLKPIFSDNNYSRGMKEKRQTDWKSEQKLTLRKHLTTEIFLFLAEIFPLFITNLHTGLDLQIYALFGSPWDWMSHDYEVFNTLLYVLEYKQKGNHTFTNNRTDMFVGDQIKNNNKCFIKRRYKR